VIRSEREQPLRWAEVAGWFDARRRRLGMWAFVLNRITGLLLTLYLFVHFAAISALYLGEPAWDGTMRLFRTPPFLAFDILLLAALLYHGLNGIRLSLLAINVGVPRQKTVFWSLMTTGALVLVYCALRIFKVLPS